VYKKEREGGKKTKRDGEREREKLRNSNQPRSKEHL
jgi:hypothetical protein